MHYSVEENRVGVIRYVSDVSLEIRVQDPLPHARLDVSHTTSYHISYLSRLSPFRRSQWIGFASRLNRKSGRGHRTLMSSVSGTVLQLSELFFVFPSAKTEILLIL